MFETIAFAKQILDVQVCFFEFIALP